MADDRKQLLLVWKDSVSVMHIAHNLSAARYDKRHRWFGGLTASLSALVTVPVFIALQDKSEIHWLVITGILSVSAAIFTALNTFLEHDGRSQKHHQAAILFQALRREIEEEIALMEQSDKSDNYEKIRILWKEALSASPPLPQDLHDRVKHSDDNEFSES